MILTNTGPNSWKCTEYALLQQPVTEVVTVITLVRHRTIRSKAARSALIMSDKTRYKVRRTIITIGEESRMRGVSTKILLSSVD